MLPEGRGFFPRVGLLLATIAALGGLGLLYENLFRAQMRGVLEAELSRARAPAAVVQFYAQRNYAPLWVARPSFRQLRAVGSISRDGDQAEALAATAHPDRGPALAGALRVARSGRPADLARAEVALSLGVADYVSTTWPARRSGDVAFVDPELRTPNGPGAVLARVASEPSARRYLVALAQINPIYHRLQDGLATYRAAWSRLPQVQVPAGPDLAVGSQGERVRMLRTRLAVSDPGAGGRFDFRLANAVVRFQQAHGLAATGVADASTISALNAGFRHYEQLILDSLQRARALPPTTANRFVVVNVPAAQLSYYQAGVLVGGMRVIVGTRDEPTPVMAGILRSVVFNPFWNVPIDIVRNSIAPQVMKRGPRYFEAAHLQALSDWTDNATEVDPHDIDWGGVRRGKELRVRQWPGADNMMGQVKFMLPNELGIYLHDTPDKAAFARANRLMSAGCVRLERAPELVHWLLSDGRPFNSLAPEQEVDLTEPTPVYIAYLTAAPGPGGIQFYPDVYRRSAPQVVGRKTTVAQSAPAALSLSANSGLASASPRI